MTDCTMGGIIIDPGCSNHCIFCRGRSLANVHSIKTQEHKIKESIKYFVKKKINHIEISGGDPIEYERIVQLINLLMKRGFVFIQLSTHGRRFADKEFASQISESGLKKVRIPIYGSNSEIHDSVTGSNGSFEETVRGIINLNSYAPEVEIQISSLVLQQNKNNLKQILDMIMKLNINKFYFSIPCIANKDYSYYVPTKNLGRYLVPAQKHAEKLGLSVDFYELPYCVLGKFIQTIHNRTSPPELGKFFQPSKDFQSSEKNIPSYRLKRKVDICKNCRLQGCCDGFFANDIKKFGTGNLRPLT